jgi:serine/threonine protein kinase
MISLSLSLSLSLYTQKPDNVGFDFIGVLKIFDFGLAKELREDERTEDGLYKMTGCTGAVRYMSPENAQSQPYDLKTDVYAYSMIMWYILALEPPFALYTEKMMVERVCQRGTRPKVFNSWSDRMKNMITQGWSINPKERPSFETIINHLKDELTELDPKLAAMVEDSAELSNDQIN